VDELLSNKKPARKSIRKEFTFRFYAELNDFLSLDRKQKSFVQSFKTPVTVRETIESIGIPLSEVDLILVNEISVDLEYKLKEGDYISVYPVFESMDITSATKVRKTALRNPRFVLDAHLGKLAKYLRMLGFDTLYRNDFMDSDIIEVALREKRIILTRDKPLLKSKKIRHGYYVRATEKHEQLNEVVQKFDLFNQFKSFTRCMTCNAVLVRKKKEEIIHKIDQETASIFDEFYYCPVCDKVFWKGSHFERMEKLILSLLIKSS
jgi:uncharacterized protein with PIN domain